MRIWATAMACGIFLALCGNAARSDTDECRELSSHYNAGPERRFQCAPPLRAVRDRQQRSR